MKGLIFSSKIRLRVSNTVVTSLLSLFSLRIIVLNNTRLRTAFLKLVNRLNAPVNKKKEREAAAEATAGIVATFISTQGKV